jgi:hypothetical protein
MASWETEFFENIGGVKSYPVDVFRLAGQRKIRSLLDDGAARFRSALSASHQSHQAASDREPCDHRCANPNSDHKDPILLFRLAVLPACCQVALDAKDRYRIGGGQITPRSSYLDQGGTTPLLRAYAIDCPRCSC